MGVVGALLFGWVGGRMRGWVVVVLGLEGGRVGGRGRWVGACVVGWFDLFLVWLNLLWGWRGSLLARAALLDALVSLSLV